MMKYFVILCLCLTMGVVLAQEQETTTEKRVARDVNMPQMPSFPEMPSDMMSGMAQGFANGVERVANAMKDMIPGGSGMEMNPSRRRRSPQQNSQPPKPPKTQ